MGCLIDTLSKANFWYHRVMGHAEFSICKQREFIRRVQSISPREIRAVSHAHPLVPLCVCVLLSSVMRCHPLGVMMVIRAGRKDSRLTGLWSKQNSTAQAAFRERGERQKFGCQETRARANFPRCLCIEERFAK
jgi:hypothetical protein